ncbi:hypothetical protein D3C72_852610 [compost metagenome]
MPKPSSKPRWGTSGAVITEPSEGKKNIGWLSPEKPPDGVFNWLFNLIYQWIDWLDGATGEDFAVSTTDSDTIAAAIAGLMTSVGNLETPGTMIPTYVGRRLTQVDVGANRYIVNWSTTATKITSIVFQAPAGATVATYTPTYTGRKVTALTKS